MIHDAAIYGRWCRPMMFITALALFVVTLASAQEPDCALRPGLNSITLLPVTNSTGQGSPKLVQNMTRAFWSELTRSHRFQLVGLNEFNPTIKRSLDEQSLQKDVVDAYKQTPSVESATPLILKAGVPFLLVVTIQDYKEILPPAQPIATLTEAESATTDFSATTTTATDASSAGSSDTAGSSGTTAEAATTTTGEGERAQPDAGGKKPARKPKKQAPQARVEITVMAQMFVCCGDESAPIQDYKSMVMVGVGSARVSKKHSPDMLDLEQKATQDAARNVVKEMIRSGKKRK